MGHMLPATPTRLPLPPEAAPRAGWRCSPLSVSSPSHAAGHAIRLDPRVPEGLTGPWTQSLLPEGQLDALDIHEEDRYEQRNASEEVQAREVGPSPG